MTATAGGVSLAWDRCPSATRRGTVLMLPGRAYTCEMPLLAWATRVLQGAGWTVFHARWALPSLPERPRDVVEGVLREFEAVHKEAGPVLVVAKSLGTLAAHRAAERRYPAIWLTPVLRATGLHPLAAESEALASRLRDYPGPNLVVGGTADDLWLSGFRGTGTVVELPDADHGLEAADWQTSFRNHERALLAVQRFVTALPE